jgi:hypothetical protein
MKDRTITYDRATARSNLIAALAALRERDLSYHAQVEQFLQADGGPAGALEALQRAQSSLSDVSMTVLRAAARVGLQDDAAWQLSEVAFVATSLRDYPGEGMAESIREMFGTDADRIMVLARSALRQGVVQQLQDEAGVLVAKSIERRRRLEGGVQQASSGGV